MKRVDYIIVGFGIAGLCFAEILRQNQKSFIVISNSEAGATAASGGVLNPTVLKRFTAAWRASDFIEKAVPFYKSIAQYIDATVISEVKIKRILNSVEEQNDWIVASDNSKLSSFLDSKLETTQNNSINAPYALGVVNSGYQIYPKKLLQAYKQKLQNEGKYIDEAFSFDALVLKAAVAEYKTWNASKIVFAEGAKVIENPFFPYREPKTNKSVFIGNKGDYIIIKAVDLKTNAILKGGMMLIPLGNDLYKVGATYDRHNYNATPSLEKREEIAEKLQKMISCPFEVVDQVAGVRPTIKDRRPLIGTLNNQPQIAFLNGLGTRGLSMAPLLSYWLYDQLAEAKTVPTEVDINRFKKT